MTVVESYEKWTSNNFFSRVPPDLPLALMDISIGIIYLCSPHTRFKNTSLAIAKDTFSSFTSGSGSIRIWGALFLAVGLVLTVSLYSRRQFLISFVRIIGSALMMAWALLYLLSGLQNDTASFIGVPVFVYLSYRHSFAPVVRVRGHGGS